MSNLFDKTLRIICIAILVGTLFIGCTQDSKEVQESTGATENLESIKEGSEEIANDINSTFPRNEVVDVKGDWNKNAAYDITQVDVPPLFDSTCSDADDPKKCSEDKLLSFIAKNLKSPKGWNKKSLEQVLIVVEKDGTLQGVQYVASGNKEGCPECQQAAMDVIGKIKNWVPAMKDGKPVASKMAIPVKFG